jgi:hypothetical protein
MRTSASLIPNLDYEIRKTKTKTRKMQDKNSIGFYCKYEMETEQGCDKKHTQN